MRHINLRLTYLLTYLHHYTVCVWFEVIVILLLLLVGLFVML